MENTTGKASQLRMGAICAWVAGICYVLIVLCALFSPSSVASYVTSAQYFKDFQGYHTYFIFLKWVMAIANAALIGVVGAVYCLRHVKHEGYLTLLTLLAIIGLGVGMFQSVVDATQVPHLADRYEVSSPAIQHVIIAFGVANPAIYVLSLGLPGLWFITVGLCYARRFPKFLVFLTIAWGLGNITTVVAHMLVLIWLIYLVAIGALFMAPLWSFWQSRFFWKKAKECEQ